MPLSKAKRKYLREYIKKRYHTDEEFREKMKAVSRRCGKIRYEEKRTWAHRNPEIAKAYVRGYNAGIRKIIREMLEMFKVNSDEHEEDRERKRVED